MLALAAGLALTSTTQAQVVLTDIGPTAPTLGPDDISQLTAATAAQKPDGLNYYFDNSSPPGQTFTTGSNPQGYVLTTLSILTAGGGGSLPAGGQAYVLYLYTVSGSTATPLTSFTSANNFTFTETDWLPEKIETDYYLQLWNGSAWVTYSTSFNYMYDTDYMALSIYRYVAHGYYYRLKTVHMGWMEGTYDERTLYSSYIYVS